MSRVVWPDELVEKVWDVCCCVYDLRACKMLEQKLRKGTGTEHLLEVNSCQCGPADEESHPCANHADHRSKRRETLSPYCYSKHREDSLGRLLQQASTKKYFIADHLECIFEEIARVYKSVCDKKRKELDAERKLNESEKSLFSSSEEQAGLLAACLTMSIEKRLLSYVNKERLGSEKLSVKDGGTLAYPQSYKIMFPQSPYCELSAVPPDTMTTLMTEKGWGIIPNFLDSKALSSAQSKKGSLVPAYEAIQDDVEWLLMHNLFDSQTPFGPNPHRNDLALWLNAGDIPKDLHGIITLSRLLTSLPFEMNNKTQAKLSINNNILVSWFGRGSYFREHKDNEMGVSDNGRTFTFVYSVYEGTCVVVRSGEGVEETVRLGANSVLVMKSRRVSYAIPEDRKNRSLVYYWCHGLNEI